MYTCVNVTFDEGKEFGKQILNQHPDVDGIFAITDLVVIGTLSYLTENGVKVPDNIAVIGFSNWFMSQAISPKLSSVDQPSYEMSAVAFDLLLEEMINRKHELPFKTLIIELDTSIIERESSMKSKI